MGQPYPPRNEGLRLYSYTYDKETGGILLNSSPIGFSKEPRPVYAAELDVLGFDRYWNYDRQTEVPYMWAEAKYPEFITASFTHDLEKITLAEDKTSSDVLDLFGEKNTNG